MRLDIRMNGRLRHVAVATQTRELVFTRFHCRRLTYVLLLSICTTCCFSQTPAPADTSATAESFGFDQVNLSGLNQHQFSFEETPSQFQPLLVQLILETVPHDYENKKHWGGTKEIVSGLNVKLDRLQVRTKRRRKEVNHGTWSRYHVTLVDPQEFFQLQLLNLREESPGLVAFDLLVGARLATYGRMQEWRRGVRLLSISANALADVELRLDCRMTSQLDASHLPPDILLQPQVVAASIRLKQFELERLSKADGPVVRELGDGIEKMIRKKLHETDKKLVDKINRQIKKHEGDLRISFRDISAGLFGKVSDANDPK